MALDKILNVVSHFRFEVGSAIAGATQLGGSLQKVQSISENINKEFKFMALRGALELSGGQVGMVGLFKKSLDHAEELYNYQRRIATLLSNNPSLFIGSSKKFADNMKLAAGFTKQMAREAFDLGISQREYFYKVQSFYQILAPKGAAGENLKGARDLARNALLAREMIPGIHPGVFSQQLQNLVQGLVVNPRQNLWRKLKAETKTFSGMSLSAFRQGGDTGTARRVEQLNKAFKELFKNRDAEKARINTITAQLERLNNLFRGMHSIFTPLGKALRQFVIDNLRQLAFFVRDEVGPLMERLARGVGDFVRGKSLLDLYSQIQKFATLSKSHESAKFFSFLSYALFEIGKLMKGNTLVKVATYFKNLGGFMGKGIASVISALGKWREAIGFLIPFILKSIVHYTKFYTVFMMISRLFETAKIFGKQRDIEATSGSLKKTGDAIAVFGKFLKTITTPLYTIVDILANWISPLFSVTWWVEKLAGLLAPENSNIKSFADAVNILDKSFKNVSDTFLHFSAFSLAWAVKIFPYVVALKGAAVGAGTGGAVAGAPGALVGAAIGGGLGFLGGKKLQSFASPDGKFDVQKLAQTFFREFSRNNQQRLEDAKVQKSVINVSKMEIRNQFPENMEPDRIAMSIKDAFIRAAQAPLGSPNSSPVKTPGFLQAGP